MNARPDHHSLLEIALRHVRHRAASPKALDIGIQGLSIVHADAPGDIDCAVSRPLCCLVLQGSKQVTMGMQTVSFGECDTLLITADVPTVSQITAAEPGRPYVSLVLELDPAIISELAVEMRQTNVQAPPLRVEQTNAEVAEAALKLLQLLDRPASIPVLAAQRLREIHYWLLAGERGSEIGRLGWPDSHSRRVARTVALLRADYAKPLRIERLASVAGMSRSAFHQHFRAVTSLSPLQFQKQMRLIEARRLMVSEGQSASSAAFAVGYESVSQFTREYGRMFGRPPARDAECVRRQTEVAA